MTAVPSRAEEIGAVVVTYHPDAAFASRVAACAKQVADTVIVDNASNESVRRLLAELALDEGIHLLQNEKNLGVATALNQGVRWLRERGYRWALLLDQDTVPSDHMVEILIDVYHAVDEPEHIAVVGSNYSGQDGAPAYRCRGNESRWMTRKTVITSGSLISMRVFDLIGPFRDDLFIDHVDHEYCLRAASRGFKTIMTCRPAMTHVIGEKARRRIAGFVIATSVYSPERHYYKGRNHVIMTRAFLFQHPLWVMKLFVSKARDMVLMCLFDDQRMAKLKSTALGYVHGVTGKDAGLLQR